jgi:hypothetical protein
MRPAATVRSALPLTLAALMGSSCYSPNDDVVPTSAAGDDDTGGGSSGDTDDGVASSASSATSNATSASSTTASSTSASSTSADPSDSTGSSPTETSADASTGEPADPYCGDGNVDPGEECDLGGDNALTAECRPDCNLARCGDGDVWQGGEGCDDGDGNNVLEVGACAPDCSRVIEEKVITMGVYISDGNLAPNPVASMDGQCDPGFKALFVVAGVRQATDGTPYTADDPIDWPLEPYTAYVREDGELVWITDESPLLGVRDGASQALEVEIRPPSCSEFLMSCSYWDGVTGMNSNWTNSASNTCNGWTSGSDANSMGYGNAESTTGYLTGAGTTECDLFPITLNLFRAPYCVEQ